MILRSETSFLKGVVLGAALLLSACMVDASSGLTVVQNQIPEAKDGTCSIPASATTERNLLGTYDVALDHNYPYYLYPLIQNTLPHLNESPDQNLIRVDRWSVKIEPPPGVTVAWSDACPAEFDFPSPVGLQPGDQASTVVEAMRPCHGGLLRQLLEQGKLSTSPSERVLFRLIARAKGRHGSTDIKSDPFEFPVHVCYGCLQTGYGDPAYADFAFPHVPSCDKLLANPFPGNPCNPAQDKGPILCCALDAEGKMLECPGVPRGTPPPTMP